MLAMALLLHGGLDTGHKALCPVSRYADRVYLWAPALGTGHTCGPRRLGPGIPVGRGAWDRAYLWAPALAALQDRSGIVAKIIYL